MTAKKMLTSAMVALFAFSLMACSNTNQENTGAKEETKVEEKAEDKDATESKEESKDANKEEKKFDSPIYDVEYSYLPENFEENFRDEKKDLLTIEFGEKNNPAKKITVQLSDNKERFDKLFTMPEDIEDVKVGDKDGKFWDDGSFRHLVVEKDGYSIYARSSLDKDETIKVVEEAK